MFIYLKRNWTQLIQVYRNSSSWMYIFSLMSKELFTQIKIFVQLSIILEFMGSLVWKTLMQRQYKVE